MLGSEERQASLRAPGVATGKAEPPLQEMEHALHAWVVVAIVPLFALVNAGVPLGSDLAATLTDPVSLGIVAGLVLGEQLGVTLFARLAVKGGVAELPEGVTWRHVYGAGRLAGIGFTMSLFVADLAFAGGELLNVAKLGILSASLVAGVEGWTILRSAKPARADG